MVSPSFCRSSISMVESSGITSGRTFRECGQIAAITHDWPGAERWFAEAAKQAPSLPAAFSEWGDERLARGDLTGAIAEYQTAHQKGPHFADPLKGWGDALARQGQWNEALAKYNEALTAAPAWQALRQARDEAAKHVG